MKFVKNSAANIESSHRSTCNFLLFFSIFQQVVTGGQYDVDVYLEAPGQRMLYKERKKQYDTYTFTSDMKGIYKFCFSNEFSTFAHKLVYFDFMVGDEDPLLRDIGEHATVLTQVRLFICFVFLYKRPRKLGKKKLYTGLTCPTLKFSLP